MAPACLPNSPACSSLNHHSRWDRLSTRRIQTHLAPGAAQAQSPPLRPQGSSRARSISNLAAGPGANRCARPPTRKRSRRTPRPPSAETRWLLGGSPELCGAYRAGVPRRRASWLVACPSRLRIKEVAAGPPGTLSLPPPSSGERRVQSAWSRRPLRTQWSRALPCEG